MKRTYHKWYSSRLRRDMELLEFGHAGPALIVFPTSRGRFYEYEDRGMVSAVADRINGGNLRLYCVDSVDAESWYAYHKHPGARVWRHVVYESYVLNEVVPLVRQHSGADNRLGVTGCSFGGYHSVNIALRHPDVFTHCISMGGAFDLHSFLGNYSDDNFYFNQPLDFLPNLNDGWYWDRYQKMRIVLATGEHDICLNDNIRLANALGAKSIPHWLDVWGNRTGHDWPWWQQMAIKFF